MFSLILTLQPTRRYLHVYDEPDQGPEGDAVEQLQDVPDKGPSHRSLGRAYGPLLLLHACK